MNTIIFCEITVILFREIKCKKNYFMVLQKVCDDVRQFMYQLLSHYQELPRIIKNYEEKLIELP